MDATCEPQQYWFMLVRSGIPDDFEGPYFNEEDEDAPRGAITFQDKLRRLARAGHWDLMDDSPVIVCIEQGRPVIQWRTNGWFDDLYEEGMIGENEDE